MGEYLLIAVSCIFVKNILLAQYQGNCPFLGVSKKMETATGMAMAVIFVLVMAGAVTWCIDTYALRPLKLDYLKILSFILVIASLVSFVEMFLKKAIPGLYAGLGIFLPLITTNCAVLGVCILNVKEEISFLEALTYSFAYAAGFGFALILFAGIRERILLARVPKPMQDTAIGLVGAGMLALAFLAFKGMA